MCWPFLGSWLRNRGPAVSGFSLPMKDRHNAPAGLGVRHLGGRLLGAKSSRIFMRSPPRIYTCSIQQQFDFDSGF